MCWAGGNKDFTDCTEGVGRVGEIGGGQAPHPSPLSPVCTTSWREVPKGRGEVRAPRHSV